MTAIGTTDLGTLEETAELLTRPLTLTADLLSDAAAAVAAARAELVEARRIIAAIREEDRPVITAAATLPDLPDGITIGVTGDPPVLVVEHAGDRIGWIEDDPGFSGGPLYVSFPSGGNAHSGDYQPLRDALAELLAAHGIDWEVDA